MIYINTNDLINQGINGTNTYLEDLINSSESIFNTLIGLGNGISLLSGSRTEELENKYNVSEIFLKYPNITALTSINGIVSSGFSYKILGNKILLEEAVSVADNFPNLLTIVYVAGFSSTPDDIKQLLLSICSYIHNMKNTAGISSFSQDLLTVTYGQKEIYDYLAGIGQNAIINKYKFYYAYSL